jgi:hypothetical protein
MADSPLLLREIAAKLKATSKFKQSHSGGKLELLRFLKNESIKAKIDFLSERGARVRCSRKILAGCRPRRIPNRPHATAQGGQEGRLVSVGVVLQ